VFFCTCRDIYWVSAKVIGRLPPSALAAGDQLVGHTQVLISFLGLIPVNLAPVPNFDDFDCPEGVIDPIDNSVIPLPYPIALLG